jgi:hypothetical protein
MCTNDYFPYTMGTLQINAVEPVELVEVPGGRRKFVGDLHETVSFTWLGSIWILI